MTRVRGMATFLANLVWVNIMINLITDYHGGKYDPIGPYPRIPDQNRLKVEMEFAEQFKKLTNYKAPRTLFIEDEI
ncbi:uncharacterized protein LOC109858796 [Pseudomyrmex gracilis]|uniref:uncharacterized protein LOC109858796 n=1 Tax=Pseudomyrmex gracilis TaxID=219809 RepID=UPI0009958197|nr:uncharacterized protein LOC109858796 [Pseudomyrmex gracilis]